MRLHRVKLWWRRSGGWKEYFVSAVGFGILTVVIILTVRLNYVDDNYSSPEQSPTQLVDLFLLNNAEEKGAVCLDGSPPGYHLQRGSGSGSRNWIVHLEGGGWCNTVESCTRRKQTSLGSSHYINRQDVFDGILSNQPSRNPDFYNWNRVKIRYCDGASFFGQVRKSDQSKTILFFRGQIIWETVMEDLLSKGLKYAKQALLTGCSAGGLATFLHCDRFHELLPKATRVKCFADGGYFLDSKDISGSTTIRSFYDNVVQLQGLQKNLPKECLASKEPSECFFPQEVLKHIKTPFFIVNSAYDWWQIGNILVPEKSDPSNEWLGCKMSIYNCNQDQIEVLNGFRETLISALSDFKQKKGSGMYINSCYTHCQTMSSVTWHSTQKLGNKTVAEAVGDWYFDRRHVKLIDCPYPCNPTCNHNEI